MHTLPFCVCLCVLTGQQEAVAMFNAKGVSGTMTSQKWLTFIEVAEVLGYWLTCRGLWVSGEKGYASHIVPVFSKHGTVFSTVP